MIDGESGPAILMQVAALQMDAIVDGDQITCNMMAACFADALRKGETPAEIARGLLAAMPTDRQWNDGLRDRVTTALEMLEERTDAG